jgi:catechol 2,3-dioxygenase-like lactoylglutathione lyase family enzyme
MVKVRASFIKLRYALTGAFTAVLLAALLMGASSPALAQPSSEHRPSSVSIRTPDFDESVRWYQDKLGFRLIATQSFVPGRTAVLERAGALIEMTEVDHDVASPQEPHTTGAVEVPPVPVVSLIVPDVDEEVEQLSKAGVDILQMPQDDLEGTYRSAQIRDNGRHRIELREPIDDYGAFNPTGR